MHTGLFFMLRSYHYAAFNFSLSLLTRLISAFGFQRRQRLEYIFLKPALNLWCHFLPRGTQLWAWLGHKFRSPDVEISPLGADGPKQLFDATRWSLLFPGSPFLDALSKRCSQLFMKKTGLYKLMLQHTCHVSVEKLSYWNLSRAITSGLLSKHLLVSTTLFVGCFWIFLWPAFLAYFSVI